MFLSNTYELHLKISRRERRRGREEGGGEQGKRKERRRGEEGERQNFNFLMFYFRTSLHRLCYQYISLDNQLSIQILIFKKKKKKK